MSHLKLILMIVALALAAAAVAWTIGLFVRRKSAHGTISVVVGLIAVLATWRERNPVYLAVAAIVWVVILLVLKLVGPPDEAIGRFVKESYVETRFKSAWPTWAELRSFTLVVIFALVVVAVWIGGLDLIMKNITDRLAR